MPFLLTLIQLVMKKKKTHAISKRQEVVAFFSVMGTGSPKCIRHTFLHLPLPPLGTLQKYTVLVHPNCLRRWERGAAGQVTAFLNIPDPNFLPVNNLRYITGMFSSLQVPWPVPSCLQVMLTCLPSFEHYSTPGKQARQVLSSSVYRQETETQTR